MQAIHIVAHSGDSCLRPPLFNGAENMPSRDSCRWATINLYCCEQSWFLSFERNGLQGLSTCFTLCHELHLWSIMILIWVFHHSCAGHFPVLWPIILLPNFLAISGQSKNRFIPIWSTECFIPSFQLTLSFLIALHCAYLWKLIMWL